MTTITLQPAGVLQPEEASSQGYPKSRRLTKSKEFKRVLQLGNKIVSPQLVMLSAANAEGGCRFGVIASRKVGGAVTRNRIKRTLREIFRTQPLVLEGDLVIIARSAAGFASYKDLALAFDQCYKRLRKKIEHTSR